MVSDGVAKRVGGSGRLLILATLVLLVLSLSGCNRLFGTSLAGQWSGSYTSTTGGTGILLMDLTVAGSAITGTWESSFPGAVLQGTLTGTVNELIIMQLVPTALPECPYSVVAEKTRHELKGTYVACLDLPGTGGTFTLSK